jgi:hypothetical protein
MPDNNHRIRVAVELNALHAAGVVGDSLEGAHIGTGTPIYDLNPAHEDPLYERIPLTGGTLPGYADVAFDPAMGAVLMALSHGLRWNAKILLRQAERAVIKHIAPGSWDPDATRFVAYSYPKIGVQFSAEGVELALVELWSWRPVPPARGLARNELPTFFDRWSYLDDQPAERLTAKRNAFNARVSEIEAIPGRQGLALDRIAREQFAGLIDLARDRRSSGPGRTSAGGNADTGVDEFGTRADAGTGAGGSTGASAGTTGAGSPQSQGELQFSTRGTNHAVCYEVQGQTTPLWCVAASVEMLLDFYRYEYTQTRVAAALGLGTPSNPKDLPSGQEDNVVNVIDALTSSALDVTRLNNPTWEDFRDEIVANRPVISFVPGHARTVAGYTDTGPVAALLGPFRGLLVYDPWPPINGVVTRWENINVQIYTIAFTARLGLV